MSVIKSKRSESEMEFIHTARQLQIHTIKKCKVTYNGKVYVSLIDSNVWSPEAYPAGWQEVV